MAKRRMAGGALAREEAPDVVVRRSRGSFLFDRAGKKYIDFVMGWCVGNFGWGEPRLERAARGFRGPDYVYPDFGYAPWEQLAKLLVAMAPGRLARCFRATGGSEAVELALQAAMLHTGRPGFVALEGCYHGNALGGLSLALEREALPNLLRRCDRIPDPTSPRALERLERRLARRDVAAVVLEPIPINLGVHVPPRAFMDGLQRACRRHGTLVIADEVATGFGRTGRWFAAEHFGLRPDLMCVAKAIAGGVAPLGAVLATAPVARSLVSRGSTWSTFGWHPRSVHVAIAQLRWLLRHEPRLLARIDRMSRHFVSRLSRIRFRRPARLHVAGLAIGIELGSEAEASRVHERCRRAGLLIEAQGEGLLLLPALTIEREIADAGLDILARCA